MEIKENTIYNCDCKELMQELVAAGVKVDWVITDPPYSISYASIVAKRNGQKFGKAKAKKNNYNSKDWDDQPIGKE